MDELTKSTSDLEREKLALEIEEKKRALATKKPWWTILAEVLGIPVLVLTLAVSYTTASGNLTTKQKTEAEINQIAQGQAKAQEAGQLATDLSAKEKEGPQAFAQAVAQNADKIQSSLDRLQLLEQQAVRVNIQQEMLKFVLLWILFNLVGLVFNILNQVWSTATSTAIYAVTAAIQSGMEKDEHGIEKQTPKNQKRRLWRDRFNRIAPSVFLLLGPLPNILQWSIQVSIFLALLAPLFNEISFSFGSHITFNDIFTDVKHLHFAAMLSKMRQILFSS
jgi:hypothetical protein